MDGSPLKTSRLARAERASPDPRRRRSPGPRWSRCRRPNRATSRCAKPLPGRHLAGPRARRPSRGRRRVDGPGSESMVAAEWRQAVVRPAGSGARWLVAGVSGSQGVRHAWQRRPIRRRRAGDRGPSGPRSGSELPTLSPPRRRGRSHRGGQRRRERGGLCVHPVLACPYDALKHRWTIILVLHRQLLNRRDAEAQSFTENSNRLG